MVTKYLKTITIVPKTIVKKITQIVLKPQSKIVHQIKLKKKTINEKQYIKSEGDLPAPQNPAELDSECEVDFEETSEVSIEFMVPITEEIEVTDIVNE